MLTADLCSVYLLPGVDIVIPYIEVDFTFGLPDCVRYTFYCYFGRDVEYRSLYRILLHIMCGYQCDKAVNKNDTREVI